MNHSSKVTVQLVLIAALFLVAFPDRDLAYEKKSLSPQEVCSLTGLKKKCFYSRRDKTIFVIVSKHMKSSDAVRYCDSMRAVLHAWQELGYYLDRGWTLHVRTSKAHLVKCSLR
jgi:hypothetical protein